MVSKKFIKTAFFTTIFVVLFSGFCHFVLGSENPPSAATGLGVSGAGEAPLIASVEPKQEADESAPEPAPTDSEADAVPLSPASTLEASDDADYSTRINQLEDEFQAVQQTYGALQAEGYDAEAYGQLEATLRGIVIELVDPRFPEATPAAYSPVNFGCERIGYIPVLGYLIKDLCPSVEGILEDWVFPLGRWFRNNAEEEILASLQKELRNSIVTAHNTAVGSLQYLQKILLIQAEHEADQQLAKEQEALVVAELIRELEYVRLSPILVNKATPSEPYVPRRIPIVLMRRIAQERDATVVYYSYFDCEQSSAEQGSEAAAGRFSICGPEANLDSNELLIWVIPPDREAPMHLVKQPIASSFRAQIRSAISPIQKAAYYDERGPLDRIGIRPVRAAGTNLPPQLATAPFGTLEKQQEKLGQLYDILIRKIEPYLPENEADNVIFVPQKALFEVPFAALWNGSQYLVQNYTISLAFNFNALAEPRPPLESLDDKTILIVGNPGDPESLQQPEAAESKDSRGYWTVTPPNAETVQLPFLLQAEAEAEEVSQLLKQSSNLLIGEQATEAALRERIEQAEIIHLAAHGLLDNISNSLSTTSVGQEIATVYGEEAIDYLSAVAQELLPGTIVLAPDGNTSAAENDGFLTAQEILDMNLKADLAVLSACQTARGISSHSAVLGIPFSLGLAGVSQSVVTLWSVPDWPTRIVMGEFYRIMHRESTCNDQNPQSCILEGTNFKQQDRVANPARALRQAMLARIDPDYRQNHPEMGVISWNSAYARPDSWAAFTLIELRNTELKSS